MIDEVKNKRKGVTTEVKSNESLNGDADIFLPDVAKDEELINGIPVITVPAEFGQGGTVPHVMDVDFVDNLFAEAEGKDTRHLKEVTAQYLDLSEFKQGEERTYIYTGNTTFTTDQGETKDAVVLMDKTRSNYIAGSVVVVGACKRLSKVPCAIRLQVNGKIKGKNGSYFDVKVFEF